MSASLSLILLAAGLFLVHYFMKRRFGLPALALAGGYLLSQNTAESLTTMLSGQGLQLMQPQVEVLVTLLPAFALLFGGPTYGKMHMRLVGASLFTILALALVSDPLSRIVEFDQNGFMVYSLVQQYSGIIIAVGLLVAFVDVFIGHTSKPRGRRSEH